MGTQGMQIYFSGLDKTACEQLFATAAPGTHEYLWCEPERILAWTVHAPQVIWLYQSPWEAALKGATETTGNSQALLARWLEFNRAIINARHKLRGQLVLANMQTTSVAALCAQIAGEALPLQVPQEPTGRPPSMQAGTQTLAWLFDRTMPDYADLFNAMEANAWHATGERRTFGEQPDPSTIDIQGLLDALRHDRSTTGSAPANARNMKLQTDLELQQEENKLLLEQLHVLQEEYEQFYLSHGGATTSDLASNANIHQLKRQVAHYRERVRKLKAAVATLQGITESPTVRTVLRLRRSIRWVIPYRTGKTPEREHDGPGKSTGLSGQAQHTASGPQP